MEHKTLNSSGQKHQREHLKQESGRLRFFPFGSLDLLTHKSNFGMPFHYNL